MVEKKKGKRSTAMGRSPHVRKNYQQGVRERVEGLIRTRFGAAWDNDHIDSFEVEISILFFQMK